MSVRSKVFSSFIDAISYNEETQELEIEFTDGASFTYEEVPPEVYTQFLISTSKGAFFHTYIKDNYNYN